MSEATLECGFSTSPFNLSKRAVTNVTCTGPIGALILV
jgi:hypothetical protein